LVLLKRNGDDVEILARYVLDAPRDVASNVSTRRIRISALHHAAPVLEIKDAVEGGKEQAQTGRAAWGVLGSAAGRACFGLLT